VRRSGGSGREAGRPFSLLDIVHAFSYSRPSTRPDMDASAPLVQRPACEKSAAGKRGPPLTVALTMGASVRRSVSIRTRAPGTRCARCPQPQPGTHAVGDATVGFGPMFTRAAKGSSSLLCVFASAILPVDAPGLGSTGQPPPLVVPRPRRASYWWDGVPFAGGLSLPSSAITGPAHLQPSQRLLADVTQKVAKNNRKGRRGCHPLR
jgi:hypothetical protein